MGKSGRVSLCYNLDCQGRPKRAAQGKWHAEQVVRTKGGRGRDKRGRVKMLAGIEIG